MSVRCVRGSVIAPRRERLEGIGGQIRLTSGIFSSEGDGVGGRRVRDSTGPVFSPTQSPRIAIPTHLAHPTRKRDR